MAVSSLVLVATVVLARALYPADLPTRPPQDFVAMIFDNRLVIWAARLLLLSAAAVLAFGGVFITTSIVVRMRSGHWLRRAGPFEVSDGMVDGLEDESMFPRGFESRDAGEVAQLRERVRKSDRVIERLRGELDERGG